MLCVHTQKLFPPKEEMNSCQGLPRVHPESLGSSRCRWQEAAQQTSEGPEVVSLVILLELAVDVGHPVQNQPPVSGPYQPHGTHSAPQARRGDPTRTAGVRPQRPSHTAVHQVSALYLALPQVWAGHILLMTPRQGYSHLLSYQDLLKVLFEEFC